MHLYTVAAQQLSNLHGPNPASWSARNRQPLGTRLKAKAQKRLRVRVRVRHPQAQPPTAEGASAPAAAPSTAGGVEDAPQELRAALSSTAAASVALANAVGNLLVVAGTTAVAEMRGLQQEERGN